MSALYFIVQSENVVSIRMRLTPDYCVFGMSN